MQAESKAKRDEIYSDRTPKLHDLGMYLFRNVNRIVLFDTVQYSNDLLYSMKKSF